MRLRRIVSRLDSDDFELFGLRRRFQTERGDLDCRRRALQAEVHPDRFASSDASARRVAMQWAARVNEAYARLKNPLQRAAYLCELHGVAIDAENNTAMPADFLIQQMAWREALDDAVGREAVQALLAGLETHRARAYQRLRALLDETGDFAAAAQEVRALMFVERFAGDVEDRLAAFEG